jgi:hypothetical protein
MSRTQKNYLKKVFVFEIKINKILVKIVSTYATELKVIKNVIGVVKQQ